MAITIKPKYISTIPDDTEAQDTGQITPTRWNDGHEMAMDTGALIGRATAGSGPVEELDRGGALSILNLTKADVGLGNVNNTSDASKPISTATQTALDLKLDASDTRGVYDTKTEAAADTIAGSVDVVVVQGALSALDGGGGKYLRTLSSVRGAFQDQSTTWWKPDLTCPIKPETFGAKGGDLSFDDSTGIQEMLEAIADNGRGVGVLTPGRTYYPADDAAIVIDPYRQTLIGFSGALDFRNKTFGNPSAMPELLSNPGFTSTAAWLNLPTNVNNWVISGGVATHTTTGAEEYGGLYQTVPMVNGKRYRMEAIVNQLDAGPTQSYLTFAVRDGGPDAGGYYAKTVYAPISSPTSVEFEFVWSFPTGTGWFQFKNNNPGVVESISFKEVPANACVSITGAGDTGSYYGQAPQFIEGLSIIGPSSGDGREYGEGVFSYTGEAGYSSRFTLRSFDVHNFGTGIKFFDRSYAPRLIGGDIYACNVGAHFVAGSQDAGENIRFFEVDIYNSDIGILNEGAYLHATMCSIDYCGTHLVKLVSGYAHFFGCHFERHAGSVADSYPFFVSGDAELETHGGYIQINHVPSTSVLDYIFWLENQRSRWFTFGTREYGFNTATAEIIGGLGRKIGSLEGIGNKDTNSFVKKDDNHNMTSVAAGDGSGNLIWDAIAYGGARTDPRTTAYAAITVENTIKRTPANRTLKVTKGGGSNDPGTISVFIPVTNRGMFSYEWWIELLDTTGSGTVYFWHTMNWVQRNGFDANGVPVISRRLYSGEFAQAVVLGTGLPTWTRIAQTSVYDDDTTVTDGYRPDWATHIEIAINLVNVPGGSNLYIADAMANIL